MKKGGVASVVNSTFLQFRTKPAVAKRRIFVGLPCRIFAKITMSLAKVNQKNISTSFWRLKPGHHTTGDPTQPPGRRKSGRGDAFLRKKRGCPHRNRAEFIQMPMGHFHRSTGNNICILVTATHSCLLFRRVPTCWETIVYNIPILPSAGHVYTLQMWRPEPFHRINAKRRIAEIGGGEDAMEEKIVKSSQVKSKCAGPKAAPLGREQTKCRIVPDNLLYNVILFKFRPHPRTIRSSLHNPIVKAFPDAIFSQPCFPRQVVRVSVAPLLFLSRILLFQRSVGMVAA